MVPATLLLSFPGDSSNSQTFIVGLMPCRDRKCEKKEKQLKFAYASSGEKFLHIHPLPDIDRIVNKQLLLWPSVMYLVDMSDLISLS